MSIEDDIENSPEFRCSQMRAGETLDDEDVAAIQVILDELEKVNGDDAFSRGRIAGLREVGGDELVTAAELDDKARIKRSVRKAMARFAERAEKAKREIC